MGWKIRLDHKDKDKVAFQLVDVPLSVANGIRRVCLAEVPGVAIDPKSVTFSQDDGNINSSCMDDEVLAARLTLLPVKIAVEDAEMYEIKMCNPSNPEAPYENTGDANEYFTTQHLVIHRNNKPVKHNEIFHEEMLITTLKPGEQLKTSCKLLAQSPKVAVEQAMAWSCCWVTHWEYKTEKPDAHLLSEQYKYIGAENGDPRHFIVGIETNGYFAKDAIQVVKIAWTILLSKVQQVLDNLKKYGDPTKGVYIPTRDSSGMLQDATYMSVQDDPAVVGLRKYHFYSEDDTLGHLLVEAVLETLSQSKQGHHPQNYVGYEKTPFAELILKVRDNPDKDPTLLLARAAEQLEKKLQDALKQWNALMG